MSHNREQITSCNGDIRCWDVFPVFTNPGRTCLVYECCSLSLFGLPSNNSMHMKLARHQCIALPIRQPSAHLRSQALHYSCHQSLCLSRALCCSILWISNISFNGIDVRMLETFCCNSKAMLSLSWFQFLFRMPDRGTMRYFWIPWCLYATNQETMNRILLPIHSSVSQYVHSGQSWRKIVGPYMSCFAQDLFSYDIHSLTWM